MRMKNTVLSLPFKIIPSYYFSNEDSKEPDSKANIYQS